MERELEVDLKRFEITRMNEKAENAVAAIGAISTEIAGVITLAMGKAFIGVCKMVKLGKLSEADLTLSKGASIMKEQFKEQRTFDMLPSR